jgi:hypothetical protein
MRRLRAGDGATHTVIGMYPGEVSEVSYLAFRKYGRLIISHRPSWFEDVVP